MRRVRSVTLILALVGAGASPAAGAPTAADVAEAKACFERGRVAFARQDYQGAVDAFRAGYELSPRPLFRFNVAQSLRKLASLRGDDGATLKAARDEYRAYIDTAQRDEPERVDALRQLMEIEGKLAVLPPSLARPVTPVAASEVTVAAPASVEGVRPPAPASALAPSASPSALPSPSPSPSSWLGRNGVWLGVVAGVVVAGAVASGVWAATACHASLGCVDARR